MNENSNTGGLGESAQTPSVCRRHPEVETSIRCQRCRQPACVLCRKEAAVGFQCVDCVKQGAASVRQARTQFGGVVRTGAPVVTLTFIGICVVAFILQLVTPDFTRAFLYAPYLTMSEPWRIITSAFLHAPGSIFHIGFNMYLLYLFGPDLEMLMGRLRFASVYLISALGGAIAMLAYAGATGSIEAWAVGMYGASGAVFGLFSAALLVARHLGRDYTQILVLMGINFALPLLPFFSNIAWQAHMGGAATGAILTWILLRPVEAKDRSRMHAVGFSAVLVGIAIITWLSWGQLPV